MTTLFTLGILLLLIAAPAIVYFIFPQKILEKNLLLFWIVAIPLFVLFLSGWIIFPYIVKLLFILALYVLISYAGIKHFWKRELWLWRKIIIIVSLLFHTGISACFILYFMFYGFTEEDYKSYHLNKNIYIRVDVNWWGFWTDPRTSLRKVFNLWIVWITLEKYALKWDDYDYQLNEQNDELKVYSLEQEWIHSEVLIIK